MAVRTLLLCLVAAVLSAQSNNTDRAKQAVDWLLAGKYAELAAWFTPEMNKTLPEETLRNQVGPALKAMGTVQGVDAPIMNVAGDSTIYVFPVRLSNVPIDVTLTLDKEGKVSALFMRPKFNAMPPAPAWQPPTYSKAGQFREKSLTIGDEWKLPATLTLPNGFGPFPAVVLVHGSGPQDQDETIGPNKPFRDLAEGLASRGIAVLRYAKRTREHAQRMAALKTITVQQETVEDAVAAGVLLASQPEINAKRVFVAGHSLGAYLAPRIAKQQPKFAGLIVLAGNTRPLEDLLVEQIEYVLPMQIPDAEKVKAQVNQLRQQVAEFKKLKPGDASSLNLMGMPAPYLLDLRGYAPATEARTLARPILVLQGERDYQVTMVDFGEWKKALDKRPFATLKSYPALNHLFVAGEGKSKPIEYSRAAHVDAQVIDDIAQWIAARK